MPAPNEPKKVALKSKAPKRKPRSNPRESGFIVPGNVTGLSAMKTPTGTAVLGASSGDSLSAFVIRRR